MAALVTYDELTTDRQGGGTIEEIVMAEVINTVSTDRPLMALLGNESAEGLFFERLEDTLRSRGHNSVAEGAGFTAPALTQPTRLGYTVQRFAEWGQVTDEQRDTAHYNQEPFSYQVGKSTNQMMNDVEHTLHRGTLVTGTSGTDRQLEGLISIFDVTGTQTFETDASGTTFTESVFITRLQQFPDNSLSSRPSVAFCNSWLKRTISEFSTRVTRNVDALGVRQILLIERHTSDFGDVDIVYTEDQLRASSETEAGNSFILIDPDFFSKAWFKAPTVEQLKREGFSDRFQMTTQLTLVYKSRTGGGGGLGYVGNITL